jgi:hypothetical protein
MVNLLFPSIGMRKMNRVCFGDLKDDIFSTLALFLPQFNKYFVLECDS